MQFGTSAAVVAADAILDGQQAASTTHVESSGSESCTTHHDHLFCQVVRSLSDATRGTAVVASGASSPLVQTAAPVHASDAHDPTILSGAIGPRAPPLV